jgi:PAS domain S-box-containing protein
MTIYQTHEQMYQFEHLPVYAAFLLRDHLDDYVRQSINLSREVNVPLLRLLNHLSEAELFQFSKASSIEFLTYLSENRAKQQIEDSLQLWLSNQLPLVSKYDIDAQDITSINYVRARTLKRWLREYTSDLDIILKLNSEIDDLKLGQNTTFANAYIDILKERLEQELHFSRNLINASPGITYIFDFEGRKIIYINGNVEAVMGYTIKEVLGKETDLIADFIHPEDQPVVAELIGDLKMDKQGKTYQAEFRIINKQERYDWLRSYFVIYKRDETGRPSQVLASGYKINEEKETATALLKQEKQLLEAQALAHIGSFDWNIVNDTSESTPELRCIFEADHRQTFDEMMTHVHGDDKRKLRHALHEAFSSGTYSCEFRYIAKSGIKVLEGKGIVAFDGAGKPIKMTGTVQDITMRKQIEENLLKKTLELERSNIQLQEFASVASHDLKEPLRKIVTFADLTSQLEGQALSEKGKTNLQKVIDSAIRMQQLIEAVLSYSAVGIEVEKQWCNLEEILQDTFVLLESRIKDTSAVITTDGLPQVEAVPYQMQQLFQNLIINALKFSRKGEQPRIDIKHKVLSSEEVNNRHLQPASKYLQISVSDNGIGFPEDAKEKIFGLFQRLHGKTAYEGSGLGLAICRKIVESHGGSIAATSAPDKGATFIMVLPV